DGDVERRTITLPITLSLEHGGRADPVVRREMLFLTAARTREEATRAQEAGDYEKGTDTLRETIDYLSSHADDYPELRDEIHELRVAERSFRSKALSGADIKRMKQRAYDIDRGRRR